MFSNLREYVNLFINPANGNKNGGKTALLVFLRQLQNCSISGTYISHQLAITNHLKQSHQIWCYHLIMVLLP